MSAIFSRVDNPFIYLPRAGILLRRLLSDQDLLGVTHVIVDEVHERSVDSDLLLFLLRELLTRRRESAPKVILMSATAEAHLFASYFSPSSKVSPQSLKREDL